MADLSDHCFGCKIECKTREAVGRIIRASGLQGGEGLAGRESPYTAGLLAHSFWVPVLCWEQWCPCSTDPISQFLRLTHTGPKPSV